MNIARNYQIISNNPPANMPNSITLDNIGNNTYHITLIFSSHTSEDTVTMQPNGVLHVDNFIDEGDIVFIGDNMIKWTSNGNSALYQ
ncbi:hypothetical protein [Brachyspira hampsonii]|uniref:Uncharacterized protein n=1 Tax=Brachyspira hampsonii TaxID=1287055 RepID=A0AAC9XK27_9SPIR|nr:hypothetical protein [Brachyspira hampsonii]ASJ21225.1 hypothetical protein BHAMNSH16_05980 [Brachyspira hampsonii]ELV04500.1 hypothetical protein H263_15881 [Brachyspira hampsonii 30599]MBW5380863.1 hypothetical protein [Brachyspira hampsonii]MBW5411144.1 hypothetical protein [Brachyspira hampsonii]OEJ17572.1 hypothetical protein A9496_10945 [Brachyspira hampsonii]